MHSFDEDWADQIWLAATSINASKGASWMLPLAAIAITGCRPISLERGIEFKYGRDESGRPFIEALVPGAKITSTRGQPSYSMRWYADADTHRPNELKALIAATLAAPGKALVVRYDSEAISTRLRELSRKLWPRRRYAVTAYCYRHLFSAAAKAARVDLAELACAMGHRSTESAGSYSRARRIRTRTNRPFASAKAPIQIRENRSPMRRFKAATAIKKKRGGHYEN